MNGHVPAKVNLLIRRFGAKSLAAHDRLRNKGWQVPAYTLTGTAPDIPVQRVLVRLGVSRNMASSLLDDSREAVTHFAKHPVTVSMTKQEPGGFSHL